MYDLLCLHSAEISTKDEQHLQNLLSRIPFVDYTVYMYVALNIVLCVEQRLTANPVRYIARGRYSQVCGLE